MIPLMYSFSCSRRPRWKSSCPYNLQSYSQKPGYFPNFQHDRRDKSYLLLEQDKYFPNELQNNYNIKSRNYFPSDLDTTTNSWIQRAGGAKLTGKYFVELAIFIDRDLYKIMSENFPVDTEEHIIQVVLAMINAVS